jgi:hypothetical protein
MTIATTKLLTLIFILAATSAVLSGPIPAARRVSGIVIKYSDDYPGERPDPIAAIDESDELEDLPSLTAEELEEILSADSPLPSTFLMAVPALRASIAAAEPAKATSSQAPSWSPSPLQDVWMEVIPRSMCIMLAGLAACFVALIPFLVHR